jgi:hypothetical protein
MNARAERLWWRGSAVVVIATTAGVFILTGSDRAGASRPNDGPPVAPGLLAE